MTRTSSDAHPDTSARQMSRRARIATGALMIFMAIAGTAGIAVMGPRLLREGALLWLGTRTDGAVQRTKLEQVGQFRGGDPKYRLTINYRFAAADGAAFTGSTVRDDVREPPSFQPGDPVGVYYETANPANSVAEHNLRSDVYGLLFFLPFLAVMAVAGPLLYLRSLWSVKRADATAAPF